ncbi:MAG: glycosyltransferase family 4 protein [Eubacteriales bacterium]|nr:glycosyltransferase family 4 protein [Eubacteriales bacterium]
MKKIGFVIPWYHKEIKGGAEQELRGIIKHFHEKNIPVEIITTCVKEFTADWTENYFKEGVEIIDDIPVRRFKVRKGNMDLFHKINHKLMHDENITAEEEDIFLKEMVNSPDMYDYLYYHSEEYHRFVFIPYMFGTTYYGMQACPYKSVLIPCLHDENYAYFRKFKEQFKYLGGMIFHAKPEMELANGIYDLTHVKQRVLGEGLETDFEYDAERFKEKYHIKDPYIIYAGRKDSAKNINTLIQYFAEFKKRNEEEFGNLKLILIGGGKIEGSDCVSTDVIDLGFVDIQDKYDACAGAELLCQPSKNESFSIVIMESWLCERPVLVNSACKVTTNFAQESNGGLYFKDYFEFEGALKYVMNNPQKAKQMGLNGRQYVLDNFKWDIIIERFLDFFDIPQIQ